MSFTDMPSLTTAILTFFLMSVLITFFHKYSVQKTGNKHLNGLLLLPQESSHNFLVFPFISYFFIFLLTFFDFCNIIIVKGL